MSQIFIEDQFRVIHLNGYQYLVSTQGPVEGDWMFDTIQPEVSDSLILATPESLAMYCNPPQGWKRLLASSDSSLNLPTIKEYWLERTYRRFEAANYHSEFQMVKEAVEYMSEEKAIEYLKQVQIP